MEKVVRKSLLLLIGLGLSSGFQSAVSAMELQFGDENTPLFLEVEHRNDWPFIGSVRRDDLASVRQMVNQHRGYVTAHLTDGLEEAAKHGSDQVFDLLMTTFDQNLADDELGECYYLAHSSSHQAVCDRIMQRYPNRLDQVHFLENRVLPRYNASVNQAEERVALCSNACCACTIGTGGCCLLFGCGLGAAFVEIVRSFLA